MFKFLKLFFILSATLLFTRVLHAETPITLTSSNMMALRGEVNEKTISDLTHFLFSNSSDNLYLFIDSPGGNIIDGMQFIDSLKASGKKITCIASIAGSMAFSILQACDVRYVMPHAVIMQHVGFYALSGQAPNNQTMNSFAQRMFHVLQGMDAKRLGLSLSKFKAKTRDDWWMFGPEAVENKAADDVVSVKCSKELTDKKITQEILFFVGTFTLTWSGCPLASEPLEIKLKPFEEKMSSFDRRVEIAKFKKFLNSKRSLFDRFSSSRR